MGQTILNASSDYRELDKWFQKNNLNKILLVCDVSLQYLKIKKYFDDLSDRIGVSVVKFNDFQPNPLYASVVKGVNTFRNEKCQAIVSVGGGSAIDVAKCIKLYSNMEPDDGSEEKNYLNQKIVPNNTPLLAIPTTAGTGSEATRFAVIYYKDVKQSVTDNSIIPDTVLLDSSVLETLPIYQKKSTMLDALCHAIESFWSVNSTEGSKAYSAASIKSILENMDRYLANDKSANECMLIAAYTSGKAINITQTTAGHAMCYKITSLYGIAHGHAAAMVDVKLFPWMIKNIDKCIDSRGREYLEETFRQLAGIMGCETAEKAAAKLQSLYDCLDLEKPHPQVHDYEVLTTSVNPVRLKNNPVRLDVESIDTLYHEIFG